MISGYLRSLLCVYCTYVSRNLFRLNPYSWKGCVLFSMKIRLDVLCDVSHEMLSLISLKNNNNKNGIYAAIILHSALSVNAPYIRVQSVPFTFL